MSNPRITEKTSAYVELVNQLLEGKKIDRITLRGKEYILTDNQAKFICDLKGTENKFMLFSGGRGCGKSLALCIKLYLVCKGFPGIRVLLGRKTLADLEKTTLQDFFKMVPPNEYEHRVKDGLINFRNGSQIVLLGLDSMQSGSAADIKKAQQKTKSLNIGSYFLDQLEEIDYEVFQSLNDTMRMTQTKEGYADFPRQGNMTTNPANFWGYHYFKMNERMDEDGNWLPKKQNDSCLIEGSMLDNAANLPEDFVKDRLNREESYVRRFVHGEWNTDVLLRGTVFAKEHIKWLETMRKPPLETVEGCEIYEQPKPGMEYRMGIDPSEGVVDPSSVSVVSLEGRKVAKFNGMVPIQGLADKVKWLYYKYNRPLIIPEANSAGTALIREIRDLKVYRQKRLDYKTDIETERLGFRTSWDSKQQLIDHFQKLLRARVPKIYDQKTVEELKTFLWSNDATHQGAGASRGFHDDDIMSTMLAYWDWTPKKTEELIARKTKAQSKKSFQYN